MFLINGATRTSSFSFAPTANGGQRFNMAMGKNSIGNYYIVRGDAGALRVFSLGSNLANPVYTLVGNYSSPSGWSTGDNVNGNAYLRNPSAPRIIISAGGSDPMGYIDLNTFISSASGAVGSIKISNVTVASSYAMTLLVSPAKAITDFGTIGIRATGIKTT
jgi:hypothetical protein